jgi:hypothetical protein
MGLSEHLEAKAIELFLHEADKAFRGPLLRGSVFAME